MRGYIYTIRSKDPNDKSQNFYIGSTNNLQHRINEHKYCCKDSKSDKHTMKVYQHIRTIGWDNFLIYALAEVEYNDILELKTIEQQYIDLYKPDLNERAALQDRQKYLNTQYACVCGGRYTSTNKSNHLKTRKHLQYSANLLAVATEALTLK